jgi:hypothetical protein
MSRNDPQMNRIRSNLGIFFFLRVTPAFTWSKFCHYLLTAVATNHQTVMYTRLAGFECWFPVTMANLSTFHVFCSAELLIGWSDWRASAITTVKETAAEIVGQGSHWCLRQADSPQTVVEHLKCASVELTTLRGNLWVLSFFSLTYTIDFNYLS